MLNIKDFWTKFVLRRNRMPPYISHIFNIQETSYYNKIKLAPLLFIAHYLVKEDPLHSRTVDHLEPKRGKKYWQFCWFFCYLHSALWSRYVANFNVLDFKVWRTNFEFLTFFCWSWQWCRKRRQIINLFLTIFLSINIQRDLNFGAFYYIIDNFSRCSKFRCWRKTISPSHFDPQERYFYLGI